MAISKKQQKRLKNIRIARRTLSRTLNKIERGTKRPSAR